MLAAAECPDVIMEADETDNQDEKNTQRIDNPYSTEEKNYLPEPDEEPEMTESKSSLSCFINSNL